MKLTDKEKIGKEYYQVSGQARRLIRKTEFEPHSSGIFLGNEQDPSPAITDLIKLPEAEVNEKAEWLFLCGRDVLKKSIIKGIQKGLVKVKNSKGEALGIGEMNEKGISNVLDKGKYLRMEKQSRTRESRTKNPQQL